MHPNILLVDDYAPNRLIYWDWLREIKDVEILDAADAHQALQLTRQHDFALFVIDIKMPVVDGFELARILRTERRFEWTPIIFVTSEATERSYLTQGYHIGGTDFLPNAVTFGEVLLQKARSCIEFQRRHAIEVEGLTREIAELRARLS